MPQGKRHLQKVSLLPDRSTFNRETPDANWPRGKEAYNLGQNKWKT